jgi:hypothetical protein
LSEVHDVAAADLENVRAETDAAALVCQSQPDFSADAPRGHKAIVIGRMHRIGKDFCCTLLHTSDNIDS